MKNRKTVAVLAAAALSVALISGCGKTAETAEVAPAETVVETAEVETVVETAEVETVVETAEVDAEAAHTDCQTACDSTAKVETAADES